MLPLPLSCYASAPPLHHHCIAAVPSMYWDTVPPLYHYCTAAAGGGCSGCRVPQPLWGPQATAVVREGQNQVCSQVLLQYACPSLTWPVPCTYASLYASARPQPCFKKQAHHQLSQDRSPTYAIGCLESYFLAHSLHPCGPS